MWLQLVPRTLVALHMEPARFCALRSSQRSADFVHLSVCSRTLCPEKTTKIMYKASFHSYTHTPHSEPIFQREKPKTQTSTQPVYVSLPLLFLSVSVYPTDTFQCLEEVVCGEGFFLMS